MLAGQVALEKCLILHGVQVFEYFISADTSLTSGHHFGVPLEAYSMESVFWAADPQKCFKKRSSMLECSLNSSSSGQEGQFSSDIYV